MAKDFQQPENENYLSPVGFRFIIQNLPNVQWFVQGVNIPALTLGEISTPSPFLETFVPGSNLVFEPLNLTFIVDEDLGNWLEIYNWLTGLSAPEKFSQYKDLKEKGPGTGTTSIAGSGNRISIYSDASLIILNSNMKPNHQILFKELFPTMLSAIEFSTTAGDIEHITATATFRFSYYTYEKV